MLLYYTYRIQPLIPLTILIKQINSTTTGFTKLKRIIWLSWGRSRRFWSEYENLLTILSTHVVSMIRKRIPGTVTGSQENPLEPLFNPLLISATLTFKIYYVTIKILLNWLLLHIPTLFRRNWWKKSTHYRGVSCSQVIHWS